MIFWDGVFLCAYFLSVTQHICLPRDYFWGDGVFLCACIFHSRKRISVFVSLYVRILPMDYYFSGWCLFVRMYLPVTQNICLPRDNFFLWFLFVRMFLSVTQNICLPRDFKFWGLRVFVRNYLSPNIYVRLGTAIFGDGHWLKTKY